MSESSADNLPISSMTEATGCRIDQQSRLRNAVSFAWAEHFLRPFDSRVADVHGVGLRPRVHAIDEFFAERKRLDLCASEVECGNGQHAGPVWRIQYDAVEVVFVERPKLSPRSRKAG